MSDQSRRAPLPRAKSTPRVVKGGVIGGLRVLTDDEYHDLLERYADERYAYDRALDDRDRHLPEDLAA